MQIGELSPVPQGHVQKPSWPTARGSRRCFPVRLLEALLRGLCWMVPSSAKTMPQKIHQGAPRL